jgi:hypothetical protein
MTDDHEKAKALNALLERTNDVWGGLAMHGRNGVALHSALSALVLSVGGEDVIWAEVDLSDLGDTTYKILALTRTKVVEVERFSEAIDDVGTTVHPRRDLRSVKIRHAPYVSHGTSRNDDPLIVTLEYPHGDYELHERNDELVNLLPTFLDELAGQRG